MSGSRPVAVRESSGKTLQEHYAAQGLLADILAAFESAGKKRDELTCDDFARVDAFHIRGRAATAELAERVCWPQGVRVLDLGCAIGGSARYLASRHNCLVTAVDMVAEYIAVAAALTALSGLGTRVEYSVASALQLPFADSSFDMVWTEHVQMNIADKKNFYSEILRVLAPGGLLLFHDLFRQQQGELAFPVPWADNHTMNFLLSPQEAADLLQTIGFQINDWEDTSDKTRQWFQQLAAKKRRTTTTFPGMRLLMGESAGVKIKNLGANLDRNLVAVYQAVLQKAG